MADSGNSGNQQIIISNSLDEDALIISNRLATDSKPSQTLFAMQEWGSELDSDVITFDAAKNYLRRGITYVTGSTIIILPANTLIFVEGVN